MATNLRNFGILEGRLTKNPVVFPNKDGSRKVMLTLAVQENYKGKDGKTPTSFINVEAFVPAGKNLGVYDCMHEGDRIGVEFTVRPNNYKDEKSGDMVYGQVLLVQNVDLKESKSVTDARAAKHAEATATEAAVPAPEAEEPPFPAN